MKVRIVTVLEEPSHHYRISVFVNGRYAYNEAALPGNVASVRNRLAEHFSDQPNVTEVTAEAIPQSAVLKTAAERRHIIDKR